MNNNKYSNKWIDRIGERYGRLTIIKYAGVNSRKNRMWECQCDCGNITIKIYGNLASGETQSCGCLFKEMVLRTRAGWNRKGEGESAFIQLYQNYRRSAKGRGYVFEITEDDFRILTQMDCFYCGQPPSQKAWVVKGTHGDCIYTGLDRIDNTQGYVIGNVRPCCGQCNRAKGILPEQDFYNWIQRTFHHLKQSQSRTNCY